MTNSLRFWRKQRGVSQTQLGAKVGVQQGVISSFETGEREPTAETWQMMADLLVLPVETLFAPPPLSFGSNTDTIIERTSAEAANGDGSKSRKARKQQGFGRVTFLTPSQARVKVQLRKTIKLSDEEWDGVEVYVELPCEDDPDAVREAKAEAVRYCQDFIAEEIGRIEQEYITQFNKQMVGRVEDVGEEPSVFENN